jgi:hypothetical protein
MPKLAKVMAAISVAVIVAAGSVTAQARGGHGGGGGHGGHGGHFHGGHFHGGHFHGGFGFGGWGWGYPYYYGAYDPGYGDCGWVRVRVWRHGYVGYRRVWRCW